MNSKLTPCLKITRKLVVKPWSPASQSCYVHSGVGTPQNPSVAQKYMKLKMTHVAALAAISLVGSASAASIYSDTLIGSGATLNATAADTSSAFAGGTAGATWTSGTTGAGINETATGASFTTADQAGANAAFLPITIAAGYVYTLQATLTTSGAWTSLGFSSTSNNGQWNETDGKAPWALLGGGPTFFGGGTSPGTNTDNPQAWTSTASGTATVTITLNTTLPAWSTFATIGGVDSTTFTYATNPTINFVGFGQAFATSNVTDFSLSAVAVPEPSAAILGGLGVLAFLRRRRA
jgi:hypothetical protein